MMKLTKKHLKQPNFLKRHKIWLMWDELKDLAESSYCSWHKKWKLNHTIFFCCFLKLL